jgi:hypothetical protein
VVAKRRTIVSRMPGLIWVLDLAVGDVMVDGSIRGEQLRPLGLSWVAARRREPCELREQAGRVETIGKVGTVRTIMLASLSR